MDLCGILDSFIKGVMTKLLFALFTEKKNKEYLFLYGAGTVSVKL